LVFPRLRESKHMGHPQIIMPMPSDILKEIFLIGLYLTLSGLTWYLCYYLGMKIYAYFYPEDD